MMENVWKEPALKKIYALLKYSDISVLQMLSDIYRVFVVKTTEEMLSVALDGGKEAALFLTDCCETAEKLAKRGVPVLGMLPDAGIEAPFKGVTYLCEGTEPLETEYLERVYRRYMELPWHILTTKRCVLRETTEADVDAFYRLYAEPSITAYMENLYEDRMEELQYVRQYRECMYAFFGFGIWTVLDRETGEVIGRAGLTVREGEEDVELGFVIGVPWQGRGLAEEVCKEILHYGKTVLELYKVQAMAEEENTASLKLLGKLGFVQKGEYREKEKTYQRFEKIL